MLLLQRVKQKQTQQKPKQVRYLDQVQWKLHDAAGVIVTQESAIADAVNNVMKTSCDLKDKVIEILEEKRYRYQKV